MIDPSGLQYLRKLFLQTPKEQVCAFCWLSVMNLLPNALHEQYYVCKPVSRPLNWQPGRKISTAANMEQQNSSCNI
jgi:hypothetical protein